MAQHSFQSPGTREDGAPERQDSATPLIHIGQYQLLDKLGEGGMGTVYKALHTKLKRVVALKVVRSDRLRSRQIALRFAREMEIVGQLDHPHIIRATDAGEVGGQHFLVMEFADGFNLGEVLRLAGPFAVADACEAIRQAALGLQHAHEHGLVHRDIKPSNLLLTADGQIKVLDLGLALLCQESLGAEELTASDQILGTADYMAPEQGLDAHGVDIRADIYSLGCTLYKLLTGKAPFFGPGYDSMFKKIQAHAQRPVPPLGDSRHDIPPELPAVLERLLAKSPAERFAVPAEAAQALAPFATGSNLRGLAASAKTKYQLAKAGDEYPIAPSPLEGVPTEDLYADATPGLPYRPAAVAGARRRGWKGVYRWLAASLVIGAVTAGVVFLVRHRPAEQAGLPLPEKPDPAPPVQIPNVWNSLFERSPTVLLWPKETRDSHWEFKSAQRELWSQCAGLGLLRLGEAPSDFYQIRVTIHQTPWVGGVGIFLGYRDDVWEGKPCKRFQVIELTSYFEGDIKRAFNLRRSLVRVCNGDANTSKETLAHAAVPRPGPQDPQLTIRVRNRTLESVRWIDADVPALVDAPTNELFTPADYVGDFGVFSDGSGSVFRNAELLFFKEQP